MRTITYITMAASLLLPMTASAQDVPLDDVVGPIGDALDQPAVLAGLCNDLDAYECLLPLPSDVFTTADDTTPTGLRIDFSPLAMPKNVVGKPADPTEWNRNDGWSPGSMLLTYVPGIDLAATYGVDHPVLEEPSLSMAPDAPIVLLDADTGERHPYWVEMDEHVQTDPTAALVIIRPLTNFEHGHRYVVGLRDLKTADGSVIPAADAFAAQRDAFVGGGEDDVLAPLAEAGVDAADLFLAWDFTIMSSDNMAGRVLSIRDDAFAQLGDTDLADGVVEGDSPAFTIDSVEEIGDPEHDTLRVVEGHVTVPFYLDRPDELATPELAIPDPIGGELPLDELPSQTLPGSRLNYGTPTPGPMDVPQQNDLTPTIDVAFTCSIPRTALGEPATPTLYGHGLLGSRGESKGSSTERMRESNYMMCGVDWYGFYESDLANVLTTLLDIGGMASVIDRVQQGFLHFLFVGRALVHPDGLVTSPSFQLDGEPLFDPSTLVYDGNSQGGILGGAVTALAPDLERATLGVFGMNYSTLLHRSVDFEGNLDDNVPVGYWTFLYSAYPEKEDQLIVMHLLQMLWDRGETNGYAHHVADDPLPNTPPHKVLVHVALGDYQVANVSADVFARTIEAPFLQTTLPDGRYWADHTGERLFDFDTFTMGDDGAALPHDGSAIVYWDSANPLPPSANVPPEDHDEDPHSDPRKDPFGIVQKDHFYRTGEVLDVHEGRSWYCTDRFPRDESQAYDCTRAAARPDPVEPAPEPEPDTDEAPAEVPLPATGGGLALLGLGVLAASRSVRPRRGA